MSRRSTGTSVNVFITNNIVTGFGLTSTGIKVQGGAGVNVTLSHNNVTAPVAILRDCSGAGLAECLAGLCVRQRPPPLASSAMIDAGTATNAPVVDFDNNPRPLGAAVDIGAYEFAPLSVAPPTANAGPDQTFTAGAGGTASITLIGVGNAPIGSTLTYRWSEGVTELATTAAFTHTFSTGVHLLTFKVTDQFGQFGTDTVLIGVLAGGGAGTPGPAGNSVTMTPDTTVCTTGGVKLMIVDSLGAQVGAPQYVCNGAHRCRRVQRVRTGATGCKATGATGCNRCNGCARTAGACRAARRLRAQSRLAACSSS